jgi:3-oxoacyl-[acyl-carrier protein] reductase
MGKMLEGKVAIVTGSGQGVGKEIALCLAREGAKVVTNNRKPGSGVNCFEKGDLPFTEEERARVQKVVGDAESCAGEIIAMGGQAVPFYGDVCSYQVAHDMIQCAVDHFGRIDIVVNNAASVWVGNIAEMPEDLWDMVVVSKLKGAYNMIHNALPYMKAQKFGRIMNASSNAFVGLMGMAAYSAAAAGIVGLTKAAAQDVTEFGDITINAYTPLARTRSWMNMLTVYRTQGVASEDIEAGAPAAMTRTADVFAPMFAYLASDEAAGITGYLFQLGADGEIGIWSDSEVNRNILKEEGAWTIEELRAKVPALMSGATTIQTTIELH